MAENMAKRVTLLDPPPQDHSKAPIENVLDLTPVVDLGPVLQPPPLIHEERVNSRLIHVY